MKTMDPASGTGRLDRVEQPIRAAELVGALSIATDLGTGQPLEHAVAHRGARSPSRRACRSVRRGARGHLLCCAAPRVRVHVERARGGAAVRRRHRAQGRVLPGRPDQPRRGPRVLQIQRRARPRAGGPLQDDRGGDRQRGPKGTRGVRDDVRGGAAVRRVARPRSEHRGGARVRVRALGRTRPPGRRRRRDPVADASPARGEGRFPLPLRRGRRTGTRSRRGPIGRRIRAGLAELAARNLDEMLADLDETRMWEHGARERAVSTDLALGRPDRRRVRRPSPRSPASSPHGCASTRRTWPSSPRPRPGA